jgi:predicted XRE-type DNA-binding protein
MANLQQVITARGLKLAKAAELLGVAQPRVSDLMRGRIAGCLPHIPGLTMW